MANSIHILYLLVIIGIKPSVCVNNGLARTPPMGWLSWERFGCNTDCMSEPDSCIGERLLMQMADVMAAEGYKDVGYEYITVDDCWPAEKRDAQGKLQPDPQRFPSGMKKLAKYIHSKGLKLGLYEDVGRHTCAGFPGTIGHYETDAQTFADWGIDMLKFDGCNVDGSQYAIGYPEMGRYLNQTGRPILYSCEWALYDRAVGIKPNYTAVAETCNTFRVYGDIYDSSQSIFTILGWYGDDEGNFSQVAGPGNFNDADMITLGDYGLSHDQERVQIGMWSMIASPLLMSVDLRTVNAQSKALLQNRRVIAINQDPLGAQGKRILKLYEGNVEVWTKPVIPEGSFALAVLNKYNDAYPVVTKLTLKYIGLTHLGGYNISEVFGGGTLGFFKPTDILESRTNPTGIQLYRCTIVQENRHHSNRKQNVHSRGRTNIDTESRNLKYIQKNMKGKRQFARNSKL